MGGTLRNLTLLGVLGLFLPVSCFARFGRPHEQPAGTFSIDLEESFDKVVNAVREIATDGVILGTFEYKDAQELPDAEAAAPCPFFKPWTGSGEVLCKVRRKAISPAHFIGSNDLGTVAVRYVVQPQGPNSTRLLIDATFVEDARHRQHPSDGSVETSEFGVIQQRLRPAEKTAAGGISSSRANSPRPSTEQAPPVDAGKDSALQRAILEQRTELDKANANLEQVHGRLQQLKATTTAHIVAARAELKALPYSHSASIHVLEKGQEVIILMKTAYWYRVRSTDGQEGWIYHADLEAQP